MFLSFTLFSAQTYNVTFQLNTASITSGGGSIATSMYVGGGVVGDAMGLQLSDSDGDGVWTGTASFPAAGGHYTFLNSPTNGGDWGTKENIAGLPCADAANYNDRLMPAITQDTTIQACFGTCDSDGTCAGFSSPVDVTFGVDMSQVSFTYTNVYVQGSWDGWAAGVQLSDPDGDNIYEGTVSVAANLAGSNIEFKFQVDNWANQEWGDPNVLENSVCSNGNAQYTNRVYSVPSTGTGSYGPVCWESCVACGGGANALTMTAVMDMTTPVKAVMVTANQSIADLSTYQLLNYNNGSTTAGSTPYTFPAISISAGEHFIVCKDSAAFNSYFGSCTSIFHHIYESNWPGYFNGDDAIELHHSGSAIETFGVVGVDGTGESWEYTDTWAWKDTASANVGNWTYGAVNCADGSSTTQTSSCPFPLCGSSPPPTSYNVTLTVNCSNITVGPNGMYAGGGFLGGSDGLQLTDADGDGTWEGVATVFAGTGPNHYAFFNSPTGNSDWGTKENLAGLPCGDPGNYNDRVLPNITSDTTIQHCFENCASDGTCNSSVVFHNVTLKVNTANITVGPNGMYAGGGILGDAIAVPLSDADGDGTWEGVASIADGTSGNYIFLNSPANGGDWGAKEDLSGQSCSDPNNWNDRIMPTITGDTTLLHCFGNCITDGTCGAVVSGGCHYVIDMQDSYGDGWNGASIAVSVNGTTLATWGLSSGAAGSDSLETLNGDVVDFSFTGGSWDSEITFQITDPAGNNIYNGGAPSAGSFLNHTSNSTCVPATVNVTFQVDMGLVAAGTFTTPEVNGTWNNWCGNCNPMTDADGDGVWEATISLLSGSYEYKYSADAWTIQEMNDPTASCTNGNATYTNRVLSVGTSDVTLPVVCWGSCDACLYPPQAPTGLTCTSGNPGFIFTDDLEATAGWTGVATSGNGTWRIDANGTGSSGTGPSAAYSGSNYFYFEASTGGSDTAVLVSPAVDISAGVDAAELTFWMHAYGSGINTLDVGVSTSATGPFTSLYTWTGPYQADELDPWYQVGVDLTSYVGQTVYVSFTYARGTTGISYEADLAIDYVQVASCLNCVAPSGVMASNVTTNSADVSWTAGGTETEWLMVVNGASSVVTSTTQALTSLMPNTQYDVQVAAICGAGDTSALSPSYSFNTLCAVAMAPYLENFDAGFSNCWAQDTADVFDWTLDDGGTPSGGTGPSDDMTGGGNYMYTEASLPRAHGDVATMMTGDIDISALSNPELNFYSHMYGTAQGTMSVDIYDGTSYTNIFSKSGDQGDVWVEESVLLTTTATVVHFKITAVLDTNSGGQAWPGDMAIDNFAVVEAAANDLAIVAAVAPTGCELTNAEPIEVWVVNQGLVSESNFDVSYGVNGGAANVETIAGPLAPGDTAMYVFTATADMSADGVYDVALNVALANDSDTSNNNYSTQGENKYTPGAPTASGDTVCAGDTATLSGSSADGPITWYDAMTGGNAVGSGDMVHVAPTATTSYYAEAKSAQGFSDDFESYNAGDYIVQSNPTNWATWPGGTPGGLYDAIISSAQAASGSNSLHLDNAAANVPDPVLPFGGQTWTSGSFEFSTNMYVETTAYFNLQGSANIGTVWAMEMTFTGAGGLNDPFTFDLGGGTLTGNYPGTGVWFNVTLKCADLTTGTWELFIDGVSQGTATIATGNAVGGCNLYAAAGNNYYVDDISWHAVAADACTSTRTEAVVTVLDCSNITELSQGNMDVYPNPNNGEFVITTSNEVMNVTITDVRGKVVYTNNKVNNKTINVNLSDLEKGMYMINVETTNGTMTENIIIQ